MNISTLVMTVSSFFPSLIVCSTAAGPIFLPCLLTPAGLQLGKLYIPINCIWKVALNFVFELSQAHILHGNFGVVSASQVTH
jgi:hypothetical protein